MSPSHVVMALSVLNLLLVGAGLLLVYFDWTAARRRELLYLFFTEERPGSSYFASARRRRALYTRLLAAFIVLLLSQFLAVNLFAAVSDPGTWTTYVNWWRASSLATVLAPSPAAGAVPHQLATDALAHAAQLQLWWHCLEILGLGLLAFGFVYDAQAHKRAVIDGLTLGFAAVWLVFLAVVLFYFPEGSGPVIARHVAFAARIFAVVGVVVGLWLHRHAAHQEELVLADPTTVTTAFGVWLLGSFVSDLGGNPAGLPIACTLAFFLLAGLIGRAVLVEYETMEKSRHRLGRERQVIVSFLKRIATTFTITLEVESVHKIILESAVETVEASAGAIYPYHDDTGLLGPPRPVHHFFPPLYVDSPAASSAQRTDLLEQEMQQQTFPLGQGIIGEVAQSGQSRMVSDVKTEGIMLGSTTDYMRNRSMLVVPLRVREKPLGVMAVINKSRGSFTTEDQQLLQAVADQGALSIQYAMLTQRVRQKERLEKELQIARDIQRRLLPDPDAYPRIPGFVLDARATSATEVGGDYFDFIKIDDDRWGIVVADVSGKGVHAALIVAMIRSAFRTQAHGNPDVRDVLARVNTFMSQDLRRDMFITCVYGILEVSSRSFTWARAGHEPILVAHPDDSIEELAPAGFALGVIESPEFDDMLEVNTIEFNSGDRILIFTDGLTEAMNVNGEEFGMPRIRQVMSHLDATPHPGATNGHAAVPKANGHLGVCLSDVTSREQSLAASDLDVGGNQADQAEDVKSMMRAVKSHVGDADPSDDLTLVYLAAT